jgi:hypothetical protein
MVVIVALAVDSLVKYIKHGTYFYCWWEHICTDLICGRCIYDAASTTICIPWLNSLYRQKGLSTMKTDCCKCQISFSLRSCPWCIQEEVGSCKGWGRASTWWFGHNWSKAARWWQQNYTHRLTRWNSKHRLM